MADRPVVVRLEASGDAVTESPGTFTDFSSAQRLKRSGLVLLASIGLAMLFVPIPIVHLLAIPMILLAGVVLAIRQLSVVGRLAPLRMPCPKCGVMNRVGGGLGMRSTALRERTCESCRRLLHREIRAPE